ncbi:hypothetical protein BDW74DRAFT_175454 [Aspergillus multicolor]|uniref:uncharacterized protein n=1 Tax=Aspergillus multicolor TaxID=41759 RepID=UPI003CCCB60A
MSTGLPNREVKIAAVHIGLILKSAGIPNLLFGWTGLALIFADFGFPLIEFLVPNDQIADATRAIEQAGHKLCSNPNCLELQEDRGSALGDAIYRYHPIADAHFHLSSGHLLSLFKQDDILPHLPKLKHSCPEGKKNKNFILSTDPRLPARRTAADATRRPGPSGPWNDLPEVMVLNQRGHIEALLLLRCRDIDSKPAVDNMWRDMLWEIWQVSKPFRRECIRMPTGILQRCWWSYPEGQDNSLPEARQKFSTDVYVRNSRDELVQQGEDPREKPTWLRKKLGNYAGKREPIKRR